MVPTPGEKPATRSGGPPGRQLPRKWSRTLVQVQLTPFPVPSQPWSGATRLAHEALLSSPSTEAEDQCQKTATHNAVVQHAEARAGRGPQHRAGSAETTPGGGLDPSSWARCGLGGKRGSRASTGRHTRLPSATRPGDRETWVHVSKGQILYFRSQAFTKQNGDVQCHFKRVYRPASTMAGGVAP